MSDAKPAEKEPLVVHIPLDRLERALDLATSSPPDRSGFVVSRDAEVDPLDPRGIGYQGTYPQIATGWMKAPEQVLRESYKRSAAGRVMVDRIARDTWAPWLKWRTEDEDLKLRLEAFCRNPTGEPEGRPLWWWLERADRPARRDGRSLLYFILEDGNGDPSQAPRGVRGVRGLQVILDDAITGIELGKDVNDPKTYGKPVAWVINQSHPDLSIVGGSRIHPERVIAFIPEPKEDDPWDGDSVLDPAVNYIEWGENLNWAAAEAFGRRASPMVAVSIDKDVGYSEEEKTELRRQVKALKNGTTQIVVAKGIKAEVLTGSSVLPDPTPYHDMAMDNLAMMLGIPKAVLVGDAAGDLAAAQEDTRRQDARMGTHREQYADPIMRGIYYRLDAWDFQAWVTPATSVLDFEWNKTHQPTAKEAAEVRLLDAQARSLYKNSSTPLPEDLDYDPVVWPSPVDEDGEPLLEEEEASITLNGAQVEQVVNIVSAVGRREIGPESAVAILTASLPITLEEAQRMVGDTARNIKPAEPEPAVRGQPAPAAGAPAQDAGTISRTTPGIPAQMKDFQRGVQAAFKVSFARARIKLKNDKAGVKRYAKAVGKELSRNLPGSVLDGQRDAYGLGKRKVRPRRAKTRDSRDEEFYQRAPFRRIAQQVGDDTGARYSERIRESLLEGVARSEDFGLLNQRVQAIYAMTEADSMRIARTETQRAYNRAALDNLKQAGYEQFVFQALNGADEPCLAANGESFDVDDMENRPPIHPNCILPGQAVQGNFVGGLKTRYAGPARELVTLTGKRLSTTPNHPVLTTKGFVAARLLKKGDHLVCNRIEVPAADAEANDEQNPVVIESAFHALRQDGLSQLVPLASEDLHGDALHGEAEVEVVAFARKLTHRVQSTATQGGGERDLKGTHVAGVLLASDGSFVEFSGGADSSSRGGVGGSNLPAPRGEVHALPLESLRIGLAPEFDARVLKVATESGPADAAAVAEFLQAHAADVFLDEVIEVRDFEFAGDVYDLQATKGAYWCNGIATHNCRCLARARIPGVDGSELTLKWDTLEGSTWFYLEEA